MFVQSLIIIISPTSSTGAKGRSIDSGKIYLQPCDLTRLFGLEIVPLAINYQRDWTLIEKSLCCLCTVHQGARWSWMREKQNSSGWHGNKIVRGRRPDGNVVLISLQHSVIGWLFPQNNIQQVFQRLHALLQEEYSGEDLQIIACPSMEQVQ